MTVSLPKSKQPMNHRSLLPWFLLLLVAGGCATPGLMKRWERQEHLPVESDNFVVFLDDKIPRAVGLEVLDSLEFARDRIGRSLDFYSDEKVVCNLYKSEKSLRKVSVGLPLGLVLPRRAPLAYVLGGEIHGRLFSTPAGNISRLWVSTFPHEYLHWVFKEKTDRHYFQYAWLQEGLGEYFRRLYLQERVLPPEFQLRPAPIELGAEGERPLGGDDPGLRLADETNGIWSYTDWEVRDMVRYGKVESIRDLCPKTFVGYWRKFNTPRANEIYALSSSVVEYLVREHGWGKMRELLAKLKTNSNLDQNMEEVYGFDQAGLQERWVKHLSARWPDPWMPNIAMVYLVRGEWEIDGHEAGIRTALSDENVEAARRHRRYLHSRSVGPLNPMLVMPLSHSGRGEAIAMGSGEDYLEDPDSDGDVAVFPMSRNAKAPAIESYESAMAAYSIGRFAEGVEHLKNALQLEPEQMKFLRLHLARGHWLIGERERSLELYQEELLESPEMPFVNEVAWCYEQVGADLDAIRLYRLIAESSDIPKLVRHAHLRLNHLKVAGKSASGSARASSDQS